MHIGVCYRDLPLRPAYCRNPLVSRSRQVMSFLFWGGSMVLRQMFQIERWKLFIAHVFLVFFSADEEKKHVYALECFVDVWFFSLLRFGASSMCNFLSSLDISAQLFVTLDVCAIDVFDNINIYRHYCKESTCNSRNMPDDNELRAFLR